MKKKWLSFFTALTLILGLIPTAFGLEVLDEGSCGEGLTYVHTADGVLTVSGTGELTGGNWKAPEQVETLVIEAGCTGIGEAAFLGFTELTGVSIPDTVTAIEGFAFADTGLSRVVIPGSVTTISENAFSNSGLMTVILEEGVTTVEDRAFYGCSSVTVCYFPKSLTRIGSENFGVDQLVVYYGGFDGGWWEIQWDDPESGAFGVTVYFDCTPERVPEEDVPPVVKEPEVEPVDPFADVNASDYFYASVLWAVEQGITTGMDAAHFAPDNSCTRAQVVTFLWRASGEPEPASYSNPFADVSANDYFYKAVLWAVEQGITTGMDASHFGPNSPCTRAQVATFLWRTNGSPRPAGVTGSFGDIKYTEYYYQAVLWAVENGITNGIDATHFGTNATCTRGQIVTFLSRADGVESGNHELTEEDLYYTQLELLDLRNCVESSVDYILWALENIQYSYDTSASAADRLYDVQLARSCANVCALWLTKAMWIMDSNYPIELEGSYYATLKDAVLDAYNVIWDTKETVVNSYTYQYVREPMAEDLVAAGSLLTGVYDLLYQLQTT